MGFVVRRDQEISNFQSSQFWYFELTYLQKQERGEDLEAKFDWQRIRMDDEKECRKVYEKVQNALSRGEARVTSVETKQTQKLKPIPLNTVEATKLISTKLKISPENSMAIMERLYNQGYLSYPRTETTMYKPSIDLRPLVN